MLELLPWMNNISQIDKPVKIVFEDEPIDIKIEAYIIPESDRLINTLNTMKLTSQQYRSVRGQVEKGYYTMVHAFLIKRGWYDYFLSLPTSGELMTWNKTMGLQMIKNTFGIYTYSEKGE